VPQPSPEVNTDTPTDTAGPTTAEPVPVPRLGSPAAVVTCPLLRIETPEEQNNRRSRETNLATRRHGPSGALKRHPLPPRPIDQFYHRPTQGNTSQRTIVTPTLSEVPSLTETPSSADPTSSHRRQRFALPDPGSLRRAIQGSGSQLPAQLPPGLI
jgi:hypothetical protein